MTSRSFIDAWNEWHAQHESQRASEHGFLAVTSIRWLNSTPARFEDAPGSWLLEGGSPVVELAEGESLLLEGTTIIGRHEFGALPERGSVYGSFDDAVVEVALRGGEYIVRPRHPSHSLRANYTGTPTFTPDEKWQVRGRYRAFEKPREVTVGSVAEGLQHVYSAPGEIAPDISGPATLTAFNGFTPGSLLVLFTDSTSGVTTYAANRSVQIDSPDADGFVNVDFNRSVNLPCAYTDYATCPLPPAGNRLVVAIAAGERIPIERGGAA